MTDILLTIINSTSKGEVCRKLNWPNNGRSFKKIDQIIVENNLNVNFKKLTRSTKYKTIEKQCPVCESKFITQQEHKKEKTTCSAACANTFFRSGENNPNYIDGFAGEALYRKICFTHHEKKCVVCNENRIVEVHHYDENHENNKPENLVPLCPTHHRYWHSKYRLLVKTIVDNYLKKWKNEY